MSNSEALSPLSSPPRGAPRCPLCLHYPLLEFEGSTLSFPLEQGLGEAASLTPCTLSELKSEAGRHSGCGSPSSLEAVHTLTHRHSPGPASSQQSVERAWPDLPTAALSTLPEMWKFPQTFRFLSLPSSFLIPLPPCPLSRAGPAEVLASHLASKPAVLGCPRAGSQLGLGGDWEGGDDFGLRPPGPGWCFSQPQSCP